MEHKPPLFSVIVPTYNRPRQLAACVEALARLDYSSDRFEVIIVDDGSKNPPDDVISPVRDQLNVKLLRRAHEGPAAARNAGAAQATGQFLAFTDDDCRPAADWLSILAQRFVTVADPIMVGGRTLNSLSDNPYSTASQLIVDVGFAYHNADFNQARFFTASNLAVPADCFHALGGFEATFMMAASEDRELCGRWLHHGYRMVYAPEALVYHAHALTWRTFWRQHFNYGRGAFQLQQVRTRFGWELFQPDPRYYYQLLRYPFTRVGRHPALLLSALLMVSQSASAAGLVSEWIKHRRARNAHLVGV